MELDCITDFCWVPVSSLPEDQVYDSPQQGTRRLVRSTKADDIYKLTSRLGVNDNPDVDDEEESEDSFKNYAALALNRYGENHELVEIGPVAVGEIAQGRVLHFNIKAKAQNQDEPPNAVEKTFFCELIKTNAKDVNLVSLRCLGESSQLPEKAKTFGCIYCSDKNIHHPDENYSHSYHTGREKHREFVFSKIISLRKQIRDCEESQVKPSFTHPGVMYFGSPFSNSPSQYATAALRLFNSNKNANWEFVKHRCWGHSAPIFIGLITHINFDAKNLDDPDAGVSTFFAEVIRNRTFLFAASCERLEPEKAEHHGCSHCPHRVLHPPGPGYMNGRGYVDYKA